MKISRVVVGELEENCYILEKNNHALVIDPGAEYFKIKESLKNYILDGILITHNHFDHVGALNELLEIYKVKSYNMDNLKEGINTVGNFTFDVTYNKGHTSDSISFFFEEINSMFVGDFIFQRTIGRWDLPTGSELDMVKSIEEIKKRDNDIILYPGHGPETVLGYEKKYNPYFK
ncbi:MAG: MBL fold metallo-hydrolase [Bacilli bacterium]|nr:MBL fold metallo-hydrolase [Bacilli bacterium]